MSIAKLLYRKKSYLGTVLLDVVITENASSTVKITKNPVEYGADMSDHVVIQPMTYSMTGLVSNAVTSILSTNYSLPGSQSNSQIAWQELLDLQRSGVPFTLEQGLKKYENVMIEGLTTDRNKDSAGGLYFTATLTEVIMAGATQDSAAAYSDSDIADGMATQTNGGQKAAV